MDQNDHLFTQPRDNDLYAWIRQLGKYASIIHLQQTNGDSSAHHIFNEENDQCGLVTGEKLLRALKESYDRQDDSRIEPCEEIFLTMELFFGTTSYEHDILREYANTAAYWRKYVPRDGLTLDQLVDML